MAFLIGANRILSKESTEYIKPDEIVKRKKEILIVVKFIYMLVGTSLTG